VRKNASADATSPTIAYDIPTKTKSGRTLMGRSVVLFERKYLHSIEKRREGKRVQGRRAQAHKQRGMCIAQKQMNPTEKIQLRDEKKRIGGGGGTEREREIQVTYVLTW
jgi:hypothetical protein